MSDTPNTADTVSKAEHDLALNKLEVAKTFLTELDTKVSKYEALGVDELVAKIEKYEALGTPEDLVKLKSESATMSEQLTLAGKLLKKHEDDAADVPAKKDLVLESQVDLDEAAKLVAKGAPDLKLENDDDDYDDEDDEDEELEGDTPELKLENAKKKLESYRKLGSRKDIRAVFVKAESLVNSHSRLSEKLESYKEIGSKDEILQICNEYAGIRTKQESERISTDLGLPLEKVLSTIDKMESVGEAEKLLRELFPKSESDSNPVLKEKTESEKATIVDDKTVKTQLEPLQAKTEAANLDNLRQLCKKL